MDNLKDSILSEIKEKKITPKGRWQFLLKDYVIWCVFVLSVIVGSLAFAVLLFMVRTHYRIKTDTLVFIPYFWLVLLTLFVVLAYYNLKHTKTGYKFNPYLLILGSVLVSCFLGVIIFMLDWSAYVEKQAYKFVPMYDEMMDHRFQVWSNSEKGRLMGVIVKIEPEYFELIMQKDNHWNIKYPNLNEDLLFERVRVIGEQLGEFEFEAYEVMPWFGQGKMNFAPDERNFYKLRTN